jgi:molybdopterin-binding protein
MTFKCNGRSGEIQEMIDRIERFSPKAYDSIMKLSARNQLQGTVEDIQLGGVMAHVTVKVGDNLIESVITRRSAEELNLRKGDTVKAVVKSTEVMLLKD